MTIIRAIRSGVGSECRAGTCPNTISGDDLTGEASVVVWRSRKFSQSLAKQLDHAVDWCHYASVRHAPMLTPPAYLFSSDNSSPSSPRHLPLLAVQYHVGTPTWTPPPILTLGAVNIFRNSDPQVALNLNHHLWFKGIAQRVIYDLLRLRRFALRSQYSKEYTLLRIVHVEARPPTDILSWLEQSLPYLAESAEAQTKLDEQSRELFSNYPELRIEMVVSWMRRAVMGYFKSGQEILVSQCHPYSRSVFLMYLLVIKADTYSTDPIVMSTRYG